MYTDTKYAYDPIDKVPVFIGNREDWTERRNNRWYRPTRDDPEIAEHQSWGRTYWCCDDPGCASPVVAAQGEVRAWHFRRQQSPGKPFHCINCERFSGESSFHWKTALNIEKMLQRLHRQGKHWLGKDIAFVQRETSRLFAIGKQNVSLRPDVFVSFTDGDWLAIEIVYTHRPEMHHHEAYEPLANGDATFGPRVVVVDLNDELPEINEDTHRSWVREGGIEKALAREASEANRIARFKERQSHFNSRLEAEVLKAKNRFMSQVEREFPDFVWTQEPAIDSTPAEAEEAFVAQRREQLKRDALQRHFDGLVDAHEGRTYGLDPSEFNSEEAIEQAFEACLKEMNRRHQGIMELNEQFIFLDVPRAFMDERPEEFDNWLSKMQASANKCQADLEEARLNALEAGFDEDDVDVLNGFIFDHETKDVHEYKMCLKAYVDETIRGNHLKAVEAKVGEFTQATDFDVFNQVNGFTLEELASTFGMNELSRWLEELKVYLESIDAATTEALREWNVDAQTKERIRACVRSDIDLLNATDLKGVPLFVQQRVNEGMIQQLESDIRSSLGMAVPDSVWDHVGRDPVLLRSWFERAKEYRSKCELLRQSAIQLAKEQGLSRRCTDDLARQQEQYGFSLDSEAFVYTVVEVLNQHGGTVESQEKQSRSPSTSRRMPNVRNHKVRSRAPRKTSASSEPSDIENLKAKITKLKENKQKQIDVLKDPKRSKHAKKGARHHLNRFKKEIAEARSRLNQLEAAEARSFHAGRVRRANELLAKTGGVRESMNPRNVQPAPFDKSLSGKMVKRTQNSANNKKPSERLRDLQSKSEQTKMRVEQLRNAVWSD